MPPNEILPEGWVHYYDDKEDRFKYHNIESGVTVNTAEDIPNYSSLLSSNWTDITPPGSDNHLYKNNITGQETSVSLLIKSFHLAGHIAILRGTRGSTTSTKTLKSHSGN